ncbi:MAG: PAS domain S-box protein [Bacteroidales bacterium]|nr:PAS domain S-box protein [Bacteroidales bacterium]
MKEKLIILKNELRKRVEQVKEPDFSERGENEESSLKHLVNDLWECIKMQETEIGELAISSAGNETLSGNPGNDNLAESILNALDDVVISLEYPSLKALYISPVLAGVFGFSTDELINDPELMIPMCHEEDKQGLQDFISSLPHINKTELQFRAILPDNQIRWIYSRVNPIKDQAGNVCRLDLILHDQTERKQLQDFSIRINQVLLNLGPDFEHNINKLTALFGELFGATCALYNRLDEGFLCSVGQWSVPPDYKSVDEPEGHICFDVIRSSSNKMLVVRDLDKTGYAVTDPNVAPYKLKTYIGKAVFCDGVAVGSVCAVFQEDFIPGVEQENMLDMIANAIGIEETRLKASRVIMETEEKLMVLINSTPDIICFKDSEGRWLQANDSILKLYCLEGVDYFGKSEPELAEFTADLYKDAFRNCGDSDEIAWKSGHQSRTEETIPDIEGNLHIFDVIKVPLYNADNSRKGLVVFGRDITPRIDAEKQTRFLNQSALEFIEMEDSVNIFEFIGEKIHKQAGKSIVMVTSFDEATQHAKLESLHGLGTGFSKLIRLLNQHPVGMNTYLSPERKKDVLYQKLTYRKDVYELLAGAVSRTVAKAIESVFNIGTIYEMGFARHELLLGDVTIITPRNQPLENTEVIEAFIKLSAVALHRRLVNKDLLESEESYRGLFNSISSAVYIMDHEGKFLDVNEGALKMYGYPKERFIGQTPDFLSASGRNDSLDIPETLKKTFQGTPQVIEFWGKRSNGEIFPKEVRFYKGKYFGNDVVIVIANDITEQYKMISQLVAAKEVAEFNLQKTNSIISAFPDSIFIIDRNGRLHEFFSNDPDDSLTVHRDFQGTEIERIMPADIAGLIRRHISAVLESGQIQKYEYIIPSHNGRKFFEARMVKLSEEMVLAVMRNTSERMELMEELYHAKEKAEESDRLKTSFLHNISHEIRTPMNGIVGFSNLLTQPGIKQEDVREYNSIINSCSNQLLSIITDIVSIATLEAGQEKVREVKTNVNEILHVVYHQLISKANEKGLKLGFTTSLPDVRAHILADETKLNQVLTNLINNAIKFTEKGEIQLSYALESNQLKFCVEDSGIGIPEEMQGIIFDRFRQVNISASSNLGGTGLGLSISKSYIELMGGRIWLESKAREGTKFYFTIPYKPAGAALLSEIQSGEIQKSDLLSNKTLMIVEDEYINFRLLEKMLQNFNLKIIWVENGYDAIDNCIRNKEIDIILMDLKMPGIDGFETTREIRRLSPGIIIIAQTALALSGDREKAIEAGCNDYLPKPVRKEELISKLLRHLG